MEDANSYCNTAANSGPSHLMPGLLQKPSDRNSCKPDDPPRMVQATRLIFRSFWHQSVTVLMKDLDWLPVTSHVFFKSLS